MRRRFPKVTARLGTAAVLLNTAAIVRQATVAIYATDRVGVHALVVLDHGTPPAEFIRGNIYDTRYGSSPFYTPTWNWTASGKQIAFATAESYSKAVVHEVRNA